jgi:hypothetical protein
LFSAAAACAPAADDAPSSPSSSQAEIGATATISFDASFEQRVSGGALQPGRSVKVVYDAERLTQCRGEQGGIPQWSITGFYKIDDGPVKTFPAGGLVLANGESPTILLDRAGDLEIWFQNTGRWGCNAYDSAFGENYHFAVDFPAEPTP